ncbi:MAG: transcription repressor NadR [Synergistales bacterium]|nr:transcription repressor NadR [Synergistales bacterium]
MDRDERLNRLLEALESSEEPLSGGSLAERLGVSRQAIVQDVATLRGRGVPVVAMSRGYRIDRSQDRPRRVIAVCHQAEQLYDELDLIVSLGGRVVDVFIDHPIYGEIRGNVDVSTDEEVRRFMTLMETTGRRPLLGLSGGFHLHTVEADSEDVLDGIEEGLRQSGFLVRF